MITRMSQSYRKSGRVKTVLVKNNLLRPGMLRTVFMALCVFCTASLVANQAARADSTVHDLADINLKENQKVTIRFRVRGTGQSFRSTYDELYSEHSWEHPQAFIVRIPRIVTHQLAEKGILDAARHFYGHHVEATGLVEAIEFGDIQRFVLVVQRGQDIIRAQDRQVTPTAHYEQRDVAGFRVLLNPSVVERAPLVERVMNTISDQISAMASQLPATQFERLKQTFIWVELDDEADKAAVFHSSPDWVVASGGNQDKIGHIEIVNAKNFVGLAATQQPSILLHQYTHAFHHKVLGSDHAAVANAFEQVQLRRMYDRVEHASGSVGVGYATLGPAEYFAEISEAYFGRNDYFPFDRAQLKDHDPLGHDLVAKLWNGNTSGDSTVVTSQ